MRQWIAGRPRRRHLLRGFRNHTVAIKQFDVDRQDFLRCFQMLDVAVEIDTRIGRENIFGPHKNVFDKCRWNYAQSDFAIDATEREIVDLISKWWNVGTLRGVDIDGQQVFPIKVDVWSQIEREWGVATFVFSETRAVNPDGGCGHHAFEIDEDVLATRFWRELEAAAVERHKLVRLLVKAMPRQPDISMWNDDAVKSRNRRILLRVRLPLHFGCSATCD